MSSVFNQKAVSGNANGLAAASVINGPILQLGRVTPGTLSAQVTVLAETNTLTFTPSWLVGNLPNMSDAQVIEANEIGALHSAQATGTAGADVAVKRAIPAPMAVAGFKYCRLVLTTGGATGAAADTYSIGYNYDLR